MPETVSAIEAIERLEKAVRANGYRTCDDHTEAEYQSAKSAVLTLARNAEEEKQRLLHDLSGERSLVAALTKANAELSRKAEALQRENAELREALKPFATHIEEMKFDVDNNGVPLPDDQAVGWVYVTNGDFRRARALLGGENAE